MTSGYSDQARWICALKPSECADWQQGLLDQEAMELGVSGWAIPMAVDGAGELDAPSGKGQQGP